jgi:NAD(P)-dependent dehydrogenase (short-subunit alcohol dehydrogenase family)
MDGIGQSRVGGGSAACAHVDPQVTITLITGANKGLGREAARQLILHGHDVWIAARDAERGTQAAEELAATFVQIDVTNDDSVAGAAARLMAERGKLDILINNAGIVGSRKPPDEVSGEDMQLVFDTNVFGIVRMVHAFLPLLQRSVNPVIVNVSSGMGSLAFTTDPSRLESTIPGVPYPASKSAVNMLTSQYAKAFPQMRINAVDPGYTATDLNGHSGTQTVEEGAEVIVSMATLDGAGPTGTFTGRDGPVPW